MRSPLLLVCLLLALRFVPRANGAALEDDFLVASYTTEEGLPQNSVTGIFQTPDGYLWMSTYNGLARFDGVKFAVFNSASAPELGSSTIVESHQAADGSLWVLNDNSQLIRWDGQKFRQMSGTNGLPASDLEIRGESPEGKMLIRRKKPEEVFIEGRNGFQKGRIPQHPLQTLEFRVDSRWNAWVKDDGEWLRYDYHDLAKLLPGIKPTDKLRAARTARNGSIWVISTRGIYWLEDGKVSDIWPAPENINSVTATIEDHAGNIWAGTWSQGLWKVDKSGKFTRYPITHGRVADAVRSLREDREGNLWVGTENGLFRLRPRIFQTLDVEDGLGADFIRAIASDSRDNVWLANQAGIEVIQGSSCRHVTETGLPWAMFCDSKDRLWIGCYGGELFKIENGKTEQIHRESTAKGDSILAFAEHNGTIFAGAADGLWEVCDGVLRPAIVSSELGEASVRCFANDDRGGLWMGTDGAGLWNLRAGKWERVTAKRFTETDVRALYVENTNSVWIASRERGLYWIANGVSFHFDPLETKLPDQIYSITQDQLGYLWFSSSKGIARVSIQALKDFAAGRSAEIVSVNYTKSDGLGASECSGGRHGVACKTSDGRIWFATVKGVSVVKPDVLPRNELPPPVLIEQAQIFGRRGESRNAPTVIDRPKSVTAPSGTHRLELSYTALSFTAPERVRFRYRLEGLEPDWTDAGPRRVAHYQGLPPGNYKFHVIASNNDGVWNEAGAVAAITVEPHFTETIWFRALVALWFIAAVVIAFRVRVAQLRSVNDLRLRIARDLHDEIGANLGSIGLNTELLMNDPDASETQRQDLSEIRSVASQTAQSVRDIVWFTNPNFDNTVGMARRMKEVATLSLAGREFTFDVTPAPSQPLSVEFRRNIFLIFKEALHNIVKHSEATRVYIKISIAGDWMELKISDNGRGFNPKVSAPGNGLANLQRRAAEINGRLAIESAPGQRTSLALKAPFRRRRLFQNWFTKTRD